MHALTYNFKEPSVGILTSVQSPGLSYVFQFHMLTNTTMLQILPIHLADSFWRLMRFIGGIFEKWHEYERMVSDMRSAFIHCNVLWKLMFAYIMKLRQLVTLHKGDNGPKLSSLPMENANLCQNALQKCT